MVADGPGVGEFPRARLVAVRAAGERAHWADIDAHPALFARELVAAVGNDLAVRAAEGDAQRVDVHALVADADAAVAKNAARPVVVDKARKLLLLMMQLPLHEACFRGPVAEHHVLQFALAALVADWAVKRMVGEQELKHRLAAVLHLFVVRTDDHAVRDYRCTRSLELRHLLDRDHAHAAGTLQGQSRIVAERRDLDSCLLDRFD